MDKNTLRKEIIDIRKRFTPMHRVDVSNTIFDKLINSDEFINADVVLCYADYNSEIMTDKIINQSLLKAKKVYTPVCSNDGMMDFYRIFSLEELYPGRYGIREPLALDNLLLSDKEITTNCVCIVPGVAFSTKLDRLGYGKGFYDRYFEHHSIKNRIGICYDEQIFEDLETSEYDVKMTKIISEKRVIIKGD